MPLPTTSDPARPAHRRPTRRSPVALLVALVLVLAACGGDDSSTDDDPSSPDDPGTTEPTEEDEATESVWVVSTDAEAVHRIDPTDGEVVSTVAIEGYPSDVVVGFGAVWVSESEVGTLTRIDPESGEVTDTYEVGDARGLAVGEELLWVSTIREPAILGIDPSSGEIVTEVDLSGSEENQWPEALVELDGGTIVAEESYAAGLLLIDPDAGEVTATLELEDVVTDVTVVDGLVHVASLSSVIVVDPDGLEVTDELEADSRPWALAPVPDSDTVWVSWADGTATTLDTASGAFGDPTDLGDGAAEDLVVAGDDVWVVDDAGGLFRLDATSGELLDTFELPAAPGLNTAVAVG